MLEMNSVSNPDLLVEKSKSRANEDIVCYFGLPKEKMLLLICDLSIVTLVDILIIQFLTYYWAGSLQARIEAFAGTILLYPLVLYAFDLYNIERLSSWNDIAIRTTFVTVIVSLIAGSSLLLFSDTKQALFIVLSTIFSWIFLIISRRIYSEFVRTAIPKIPAVVIAAGPGNRLLADLLDSHLFPYEIKASEDALAGNVPIPSDMTSTNSNIAELVQRSGARKAILAIPRSQRHKVDRDMVEARFRGTVIEEMATVYEQFTGRVPVEHIEDQWLYSTKGFDILHKRLLQKIKRTEDIIISGLLLIAFSPLTLIVMLLIKLDSKGPVLYKQERVGKDEMTFTMLKFRSMKTDAEASGVQWASREDVRTTRIGKWLRLYHIDEIPQLWNVLEGNMSIVGPRPERPQWVKLLELQVPYYRLRHRVRPGLTGWAQVTFRYGASFTDATRKLESDLYYIKNMSLFFDFKILLRTVGIIFLAEGSR